MEIKEQIAEIEKGCNTSSTKDGSCFAHEKGNLCDECKAKLQGFLLGTISQLIINLEKYSYFKGELDNNPDVFNYIRIDCGRMIDQITADLKYCEDKLSKLNGGQNEDKKRS